MKPTRSRILLALWTLALGASLGHYAKGWRATPISAIDVPPMTGTTVTS